jgi:eukaryotic-like serine/threonine-protein kinase
LDTIDRIGRFRILERLGTGGGRDVFLAEDEGGTRVVIKVLAAPHRNQGLLDPRLADEASAYARLVHPNLVRVVDLFSAEGHFVLAIEFLDAASLNVVRAVLKRSGAALDDTASFYVGACMFAAIAAAHDARDVSGAPAPVVHRNVNPSNLLVSWDGGVKLGNFNVANVASVLRDSNPGFTWGSYGYLAPEHVLKKEVGPPADVYSASLVLWELLAGRKAIERGALTEDEVLTAMAAPRITSLDVVRADLDERVRAAVHAGLEPDPAKRTLSAARMHELLASMIDFPAERARLATILERVRPDATRPRSASKPGMPRAVKPVTPVPAVPAASEPPPPSSPGAYRMLEPPDPDPVKGPVQPAAGPRPPVVLAPLARPITRPIPLSIIETKKAAPAPAPAPESVPQLRTADALAFEPIAGRQRAPFPLVLASCGVLAATVIAAVVLVRPHADSPASTLPASTTSMLVPTSSPPAPATVSPVAAAVPTPASAPSPAALPPTEAPSARIAPDHGELHFPPFAAGHRIFVDGHVVGDGADTPVVRCGAHDVRIGSAGTLQHLDVPCGGALDVTSR